jgi:Na+-driven multidrug efflux pump
VRRQGGTRTFWIVVAVFTPAYVAAVAWGVWTHGPGYLGHVALMLVNWAVATAVVYWIIKRRLRRKEDDADES